MADTTAGWGMFLLGAMRRGRTALTSFVRSAQ
jgi:hypothetical protein